MLEKLASLAKIDKKAASNAHKEFNATLPMKVEVLKKLDPLRYLLKIGNTTLTTKSKTELNEGGKYWAMMQKSTTGTILISNLKEQPKFLQSLQKESPFKFSEIESLFKSENPANALKEAILEKLSLSQNKQEFLNLTNMFLSLQNGVFSLPFNYENREFFLQFKKRRSGDKKELATIDFYSVFPSLGTIEGTIYKQQTAINANIYVLFENTKKHLQDEIDALEWISEVTIGIKERIAPLYEFSDKMLDIRG